MRSVGRVTARARVTSARPSTSEMSSRPISERSSITFSIQRYPTTSASSWNGEQSSVTNRSPLTWTVNGCSRTTSPLTSSSRPPLT